MCKEQENPSKSEDSFPHKRIRHEMTGTLIDKLKFFNSMWKFYAFDLILHNIEKVEFLIRADFLIF